MDQLPILRSKSMTMMHVISCEYPPQIGGVADHTRLLAEAFAGYGEILHVWAPREQGPIPSLPGVHVHPTLGCFSMSDLAATDRALNAFPTPRRLILQWVPHGYGWRSLNLFFCLWILKRAWIERDSIDVLFHEVYLDFRGSWKQRLAGCVHRLMTILLVQAATRIWITIPAWEKRIKKWSLFSSKSCHWLPVPSTVSVFKNPVEAEKIRNKLLRPSQQLIGWFGAFDKEAIRIMREVMPRLMAETNAVILFLGKGSEQFCERWGFQSAEYRPRMAYSGILSQEELSRHLQACDLMLQVYPNGISTRRTSMMACLAHGKAIVTTSGKHTEKIWFEERPCLLAEQENAAQILFYIKSILSQPDQRKSLGEKAKWFYQNHFDPKRIFVSWLEALHENPDR